ncbi:MAG: hypothetical protein AMJ54_00420 [Deltaproteobacteria bacterium SG8_13]|nr:MAG: hypothetical protein AMJ54_00420 [Deltaproteobacteria bacterium SG8_13]
MFLFVPMFVAAWLRWHSGFSFAAYRAALRQIESARLVFQLLLESQFEFAAALLAYENRAAHTGKQCLPDSDLSS